MLRSFQWGNIGHAQAMRSVELCATEILLRFKSAKTGVGTSVRATRNVEVIGASPTERRWTVV